MNTGIQSSEKKQQTRRQELHARSQIMLLLHDFMNWHILHQGQNSLVWSRPCFLPTNLADLGPCSQIDVQEDTANNKSPQRTEITE